MKLHSKHYSHSRAFTLIELLSVIGLLAVVTGFTIPAVHGLTSSTALNSGSCLIADTLYLARSEAIARHTLVRFAVAREWDENPGAALRKLSLWAWDSEAQRFFQISEWQTLPTGVVLEPKDPEYIRRASYAVEDGTVVRGDCVMSERFADKADFTDGDEEEKISMRFVEFLPSGALRVPGGAARQAIFVTTTGSVNHDGTLTYATLTHGAPNNWAQINVDTLTGRVHVHRP